MALPALPFVTPQEYLKLERAAQRGKSEYLDGQIYAMAGSSPTHSLITTNLTVAIGVRLRGTSCQAYNSDLRVRTPSAEMYTYPDISVVCGEPALEDDELDVLTNPILS